MRIPIWAICKFCSSLLRIRNSKVSSEKKQTKKTLSEHSKSFGHPVSIGWKFNFKFATFQKSLLQSDREYKALVWCIGEVRVKRKEMRESARIKNQPLGFRCLAEGLKFKLVIKPVLRKEFVKLIFLHLFCIFQLERISKTLFAHEPLGSIQAASGGFGGCSMNSKQHWQFSPLKLATI